MPLVEAAIAGIPFRDAYQMAAKTADTAAQDRTQKPASPHAAPPALPLVYAWRPSVPVGTP